VKCVQHKLRKLSKTPSLVKERGNGMIYLSCRFTTVPLWTAIYTQSARQSHCELVEPERGRILRVAIRFARCVPQSTVLNYLYEKDTIHIHQSSGEIASYVARTRSPVVKTGVAAPGAFEGRWRWVIAGPLYFLWVSFSSGAGI
jgi:hypothetical protein